MTKHFHDGIERGVLSIFDMDETLFRTKAQIGVKNLKTGESKFLTNQEYNNHVMDKSCEMLDFSQFRCARFFADTSEPIEPMLEYMKHRIELARRDALSRVIILTARSDFNCRDTVVNFFADHEIDVDQQVYIERAGNRDKGCTATAKNEVITEYLDTGVYRSVVMYDDNARNLSAFLTLKEQFPGIRFTARLIDEHGNRNRFKPDAKTRPIPA